MVREVFSQGCMSMRTGECTPTFGLCEVLLEECGSGSSKGSTFTSRVSVFQETLLPHRDTTHIA